MNLKSTSNKNDEVRKLYQPINVMINTKTNNKTFLTRFEKAKWGLVQKCIDNRACSKTHHNTYEIAKAGI